MIMILHLKAHTIEKYYFYYKQTLRSATCVVLTSKTEKRGYVVTENCGNFAFRKPSYC
jgi:hypothetical protein